MENAVALAALGILGGAVVTIGWVAKYALNRLGTDIKEHTKSAIEGKHASVAQTASNEKVASALDSFETYLKDRNGRDAEIHKEQIDAMRKLNDSFAIMSEDTKGSSQRLVDYMAEIRSKVDKQTVKEQTVKHQTIEAKEDG